MSPILTDERQQQLEALQALREQIKESNPLEGFHACPEHCGSLDCPEPSDDNPKGGREKQHAYMAADNKIVAAFAGNRFGKTCANVVWALIQHTPEEMLPERLKPFKRAKSKVVAGRYLTKNLKTFETVVIPEMRKWVPNRILKGGGWDKAYSKQHNILYFADGGRMEFYSYDQDAAGMVGASLDYVVYDEPPPYSHFKENWIRTTDREGSHRIGLTPVNMQGPDLGWISDLFEEGEDDPNVTLIRGTIWDNPDLSREEVKATLERYPEDERQARETGEVIWFGGVVYQGGFEKVLRDPPTPKEVQRMDVIVGIDPGLKNAAFIWVAFDNDNKAVVFDELLLKECTPKDYKGGIDFVNSKWGIKDPRYIIDPSARNRPTSGVGQSVEALLQAQGIFPSHGQNDVQAGVQQIRGRIAEGALYVSNECVKLRGEAKKYRMEEGEEFKVVKENDHRLDALRYVCMERLWWTPSEPVSPTWRYDDPTFEPPFDPHVGANPEYGPFGPFS